MCKGIIYKIVFILILLKVYKCFDIIVVVIIIIIVKRGNIKSITRIVITSSITQQKVVDTRLGGLALEY